MSEREQSKRVALVAPLAITVRLALRILRLIIARLELTARQRLVSRILVLKALTMISYSRNRLLIVRSAQWGSSAMKGPKTRVRLVQWVTFAPLAPILTSGHVHLVPIVATELN